MMVIIPLSPFLRGAGWGEGLSPHRDSRRVPLTRIASQHSQSFASASLETAAAKGDLCLSPQAGRGDPRSRRQ
jgi:hypothetical protein